MARKREVYEERDTEKLLDWLFGRELTWAVLILTCFLGLIELLPEIRYYGPSLKETSLSVLILLVAIALLGGGAFSIDRYIRLVDAEGVWQQRLPKRLRRGLSGTCGPIHNILYEIDEDGDLLGLKSWMRPLVISLFVATWTLIIIVKVIP